MKQRQKTGGKVNSEKARLTNKRVCVHASHSGQGACVVCIVCDLRDRVSVLEKGPAFCSPGPLHTLSLAFSGMCLSVHYCSQLFKCLNLYNAALGTRQDPAMPGQML